MRRPDRGYPQVWSMDGPVLDAWDVQLEPESGLSQDFFEEVNRSVSGTIQTSEASYSAPQPRSDAVQPDEAKVVRGADSKSNHIFHEMAIVKRRIDFDEQDFRERCHSACLGLSQEYKELISELYDTVDEFVALISKLLHRQQNAAYQEYEGQLAQIRRNSVEAEALEQTLCSFIRTIQQAARQTFSGLPEPFGG